MESFHALIPPILGVVFWLLSFFDEFLIETAAINYLQKRFPGAVPKKGDSPEDSAKSEQKSFEDRANQSAMERLVKGAVSYTTFIANAIVFIANCLLALFIFPIENFTVKLWIAGIDFVFIVGVVYQVTWLLVTKGIEGVADKSILFPSFHIHRIMHFEQLFFSVFILVLFIVGINLEKTKSTHQIQPESQPLTSAQPSVVNNLVTGSPFSLNLSVGETLQCSLFTSTMPSDHAALGSSMAAQATSKKVRSEGSVGRRDKVKGCH